MELARALNFANRSTSIATFKKGFNGNVVRGTRAARMKSQMTGAAGGPAMDELDRLALAYDECEVRGRCVMAGWC